MGRLIYTSITSLDGYLEDADGKFDWAEPDLEVHTHVNEAERSVPTYLYGRRLYEVMSYWADPPEPDSEAEADYTRIWQAADKVVLSRTLTEVTTPRTRIERELTPELVRSLTQAGDVSVGGADVGGQALALGLVDEFRVYVHPVIVGGGKRALPDGVRLDLDLTDERRFAGGVTYLAYRLR
jgi:dihydrofolate reductase